MTRCVLIIAHPGHELRVFGWLEQARPLLFVLTDGSGADGASRIGSTSLIADRASARIGSVYGRLTDRAIYAAMLSGDASPFLQLADELADALTAERADCVVSDAIEGYNPSHDVCRLVTDTAVRLARRATGLPIPAYDFLLDGAPDVYQADGRDDAIWVHLGDDALARKLDAAHAYPELKHEVERALDRFGPLPFKTECLRRVSDADHVGWDAGRIPYYETYGERRVASGAFAEVVRFEQHIRPIADALWSHRASGA